ncbi:hypothetical protein DFJ73DRAFT_959178 [Zopfochytrium polystomum]|nr:hypothetical protein DFJ73DRAFT_959178 [Zopfochytrium polystomum]
MSSQPQKIVHAGKHMWAVAFAAGMGGMLFGYEIGIINQILSMDNFDKYFGITYVDENGEKQTNDIRKGLVTSSFLYGCVVGAAIVSFLADVIGRKFSIILGGIIYTAGGSLQAASINLAVFLMARVMSGISVGIMSMSVPLYIAETSPTALRGRLTTVYQLMITFGILIASCLNGIIISVTNPSDPDEKPWRIAFALQIIPGLTLLVLMLPMPRSPRWLAEKGFHAEGQRVIAQLRGFDDEDDDEVVVEYRSIVAGVEYERRIGTAGWAQLLQKGVRRRLALGVTNQFFQQWTGINVILYYGFDLFSTLGYHEETYSSVLFIILNAFINFAFTLPGMWGVERFGRRPLFIYGGMAMCTSYIVIFIFSTAARSLGDTEGKGYAWIGVLGIYAFTISFACTWGPVVWTYQSEIFPLRIRAKGTGLSTMSNWLWNAVIAQIQPSIAKNLPTSFYLIFVGTCFTMTIYAWMFIPETRGKTLEEMDEVFKDGDAVLPSENVEWNATVAAVFSLRGFHSPPRDSEPRPGLASDGETSLRRIKDSTGSLSTLSAPSASGSSLPLTRDSSDKKSHSADSSDVSDQADAVRDVLASPRISGQLSTPRASALNATTLSQLMALGAEVNLPASVVTPFSPTRKPKSSAMKKSATTAAGNASPQAPFTLSDDIVLGGIPLVEYPNPASTPSVRFHVKAAVSLVWKHEQQTRRRSTDNFGHWSDRGAGAFAGATIVKLASLIRRIGGRIGNDRRASSMIVGQWPPTFVVRLGQTRAAQQAMQSTRSGAARRMSADFPFPPDAMALPASSAHPPSPSWRRPAPEMLERRRSGGTSSAYGSGGGAGGAGAPFALPAAPPRSPRSRSVDTGQLSVTGSSDGGGSGGGEFGLRSWMIEEDDGGEISRR